MEQDISKKKHMIMPSDKRHNIIYKGAKHQTQISDIDINYMEETELSVHSLHVNNGYDDCRYLNATWMIEDNKLYLIEINILCVKDNKETVINRIVEILDTDKVEADWVNKVIYFGIGALWFMTKSIETSKFEQEMQLTIKNGILEKEELVDNTKLYEKNINSL